MTGNLSYRNLPSKNPKESLALISNNVKTKFGPNLKTLLERNGISREEFAEQLEISEASLANYINGKTQPPVDKLIYIARIFDVELRDLIQNDIEKVLMGPSRESLDTHNYPYYCGSYAIHYFNTSEAPGHDNRSNEDSVDSGILVIRKDEITLGTEYYPALCVMGVNMYDIAEVKGTIDKNQEATTADLADILAAKHEDKYRSIYHGQLILNGPQAVISLSKPNSIVTITMQNVALEVNKDSMRCNIGILSSVSHGNYHLPFAQKVVISAVPLTYPIKGKEKQMDASLDELLGSDEIASYLKAGQPKIAIEPLKDDFVRYIKGIYADVERGTPYLSELSDAYKEALVMCYLEFALEKTMERNAYRSVKVESESSNRLYDAVCAIARKQGLWLEGGRR